MNETIKWGWAVGLALGCFAFLPACGADPAQAGNSPEDDKAAARAVLDDLTSPDVRFASYGSTLPQVSSWSVHVGSTLAVVGVDDAGRIRAALALDSDPAHPGWCFRGAIDADCSAIAAAVARDLGSGANATALEMSTIRPLDSAPSDDATYCSQTLARAADWYADHYKSARPTPILVTCSYRGSAGAPAGGCAQLYEGSTAGPGATYTYDSARSLASACCASVPAGKSSGSVLIVARSVPLVCPPRPTTSLTGAEAPGTTLVE